MNKANGEELEDLNVLFPGESFILDVQSLLNPPDLSDDIASKEIIDISPNGSITSPSKDHQYLSILPSAGFVHVLPLGLTHSLLCWVYSCYLENETSALAGNHVYPGLYITLGMATLNGQR